MRKTPGASALLKVVKKHSQVAIAAAVGLSPSTVSRYLAGKMTPHAPVRESLERLYGIPAAAWETPREKAFRERSTAPAEEATTAPQEGAA